MQCAIDWSLCFCQHAPHLCWCVFHLVRRPTVWIILINLTKALPHRYTFSNWLSIRYSLPYAFGSCLLPWRCWFACRGKLLVKHPICLELLSLMKNIVQPFVTKCPFIWFSSLFSDFSKIGWQTVDCTDSWQVCPVYSAILSGLDDFSDFPYVLEVPNQWK